ncbi:MULTISPECIES: DegT/DnrJ/EryC1/StrS family aminotransferase [Chryseobacterium]|uniref:DegT/DnrJ/EryC1/StrS family aminotransferase n=1 Tax=Chryseobacterium rhizosphaerae TaxID=395937 RepID=A0ABX9IQ84_9FLAO|nr:MULTISPECIES: DegT/DnrJ/EryC1/StrS family aminotransferase [Chryseobacterium]MDC8102091.1 DegT/DnrJ/EryC1/StrS family aminotransferase [Chryseobacterium rhizosphaerae]MDR6544430.1 dTDP-4-amino-4,6-dideoxygalactose transaminase [Chryseobacterium rhizosphaerae]REC78176.1 DegT/DnrJ/EryC1/StrS family aminotransferase [Chryseobacterium rhizosphaerae]SMC77393.1 dTDP-4-amino-4,6-dideoxygalactose transaminase [Chryseobacterium sp. YR221]GEN68903.1 aminotransferase DegT [Chryseobacterium rhizosphaer
MISVTQPFLPPQEEYEKYLDGIWKRNWLTNMGPLASQLEMQLKDHLKLNHLLFVTNGTVALQMALKALEITGEVITTPFSFIATTSTIVWEGCTPVFTDIDPNSLCIDPSKIEDAITEKTTAILATHVYGNPCDVEAIEIIAKKHKLKVIYDAAHAFDVKINGRSIFEYGDISTCSLHATKLYHSIEGGLIITQNADLLKKLASIRNFGISGYDSFSELGINGKNSEFHAAMGLANLKYISDIHEKRKALTRLYDEKLKGLKAFRPRWHQKANENFAYYPIILESEDLLLKLKAELDKNEIFTRRYFYPSLASALPYLSKLELPITEDISKRSLCLPLYYDLTFEEVDLISRLILRIQNN